MLRKIKGVEPKDMEDGMKQLFSLLYMEQDESGETVYNPDKEWDSAADYLEEVAVIVNSLVEFAPERKGEA